MLRVVSLAGLLLLGVVGCTRNDIKTSDLPGTWVLADASRSSLPPAFQNAAASIVLDEDGKFRASDLPGEVLFVRPESRDRLVTGSGVWKVDSRAGAQVLQLEFRAIAEAKEREIPFGTQLHLSKEATGPILFYFQGDADAGRKIRFERKR